MSTIDDPTTRISAYLDDELDAFARSAFEAELRESDSLRAELDSFRAVRQLLRDLPTPVPPRDLALDAVREIERLGLRAPRPLAPQPTGRTPWMILGTLSAVAASLLLVWLSQVFDLRITPRHRPGRIDARSAIASQSDDPDLSAAPSFVAKTEAPAETEPPTAVAEAPDAAVPATSGPPEFPADPAALHSEQLARLLDAGPARRILISLDSLDANALLRVENAIDRSPRAEARHARLQLDAGVGFDPAHPNAAIVYVLTLQGGEIDALRGQLNELFPGQAGPDTPISARVVASLGEVRSPISIHDSIPRSLLQSRPPAAIAGTHGQADDPRIHAKRVDNDRRSPLDEAQPTLPPRTPGDPLNSAVIGPVPAPPGPAPEPSPPTTQTYLLWLTEKPAR